MTTINLYQNQGENEKRASSLGLNSGFFFSLGILIITLIVLVALKVYIPIVEGKNKALEESITAENSKLVGLKDLEQIVDMQKRVGEIKGNLQIKDGKVGRTEVTEVLDRISSEISSGVVISTFNYTGEKISITFSSNNFSDVSRQIYNLKKSEYLTGVNVTNITRGEKDILFTVEMQIKK